jgi:hypothetical protein
MPKTNSKINDLRLYGIKAWNAVAIQPQPL